MVKQSLVGWCRRPSAAAHVLPTPSHIIFYMNDSGRHRLSTATATNYKRTPSHPPPPGHPPIAPPSQSAGLFSLFFRVNSSAFFMNFLRSRVYSSARSARSGWSGSGSFTKATNDWITAKRNTKPRQRSIGLGKQREKNTSKQVRTPWPVTLVSFRSRLPVLGTDDGQADLTLLIDVGVVDAGLEADLRRLEGVLGRESDFYFEGTLIIRRVLLQFRLISKSSAIEARPVQ